LIGENDANFLACHMFTFLEKLDITRFAAPNAIFPAEHDLWAGEVWDKQPVEVQEDIICKEE
jgi:pyruvate-ferredoxin/flavodoxin oxidoreductase